MGKHTGWGRKGSPSLLVEIVHNTARSLFRWRAWLSASHHSTVLSFNGQRRINDRTEANEPHWWFQKGNGKTFEKKQLPGKKINIFLFPFTSQAILWWYIKSQPGKITLRKSGCTWSLHMCLWFALTVNTLVMWLYTSQSLRPWHVRSQ